MSIWAYLNQSEIDGASDGAEGFAELVRIAQERLDQRVGQLDRNDPGDWGKISECEMMFSRTVLNLGKSYEIEPFIDMDVPRGGYNSNEYSEFRARLDDEVAKLVLSNAINQRRGTIVLAAGVQEKIHTHIHYIKEHLRKASISDIRRASLNRKLEEFEAALDKRRFNFMAAGRVAMEILSLTANGLALADSATLQKLLTNMMQTVAMAKAEDDEKRLPPPLDAPPVMLPAQIALSSKSRSVEEANVDLDDEIPF